jgi:hypothetical protein
MQSNKVALIEGEGTVVNRGWGKHGGGRWGNVGQWVWGVDYEKSKRN